MNPILNIPIIGHDPSQTLILNYRKLIDQHRNLAVMAMNPKTLRDPTTTPLIKVEPEQGGQTMAVDIAPLPKLGSVVQTERSNVIKTTFTLLGREQDDVCCW